MAISHRIDVKSYTSLHTLVNDMFPPTSLVEHVRNLHKTSRLQRTLLLQPETLWSYRFSSFVGGLQFVELLESGIARYWLVKVSCLWRGSVGIGDRSSFQLSARYVFTRKWKFIDGNQVLEQNSLWWSLLFFLIIFFYLHSFLFIKFSSK